MPDREKTIKGLETVFMHLLKMTEVCSDGDLPYYRELFERTDDALAMLKKSFTPEEVYKTVIEHGQHDMRFKLGDRIDYTFMDVVGILNTELMCKAGDM